jgi:hypothetical protein
MEDKWMDRIKFAIKFLLISVVLIAFVVAGALFWAVKNPEKTFALAQKYVLPADLSVKWEEMNFSAKRASWRHWNIDWSTKNLIVEKGSPALFLPVGEASMRFTLRVFQEGPWFSFSEIKAKLSDKASLRSSNQESPPGKKSPFEMMQSYLDYLRTGTRWLTVDVIDIQVPGFDLDGARLSAKLWKPVKDHGAAAGYEISFESGANKIAAQGWLDANRLAGPEPFFSLDGSASGKDWNGKIKLAGILQGENARFEGAGSAAYGDAGKEIKAEPKILLSMSASEAYLKLESAVRDIPGPLVKLDKLEVEIRQPFDNGYAWSERPATFKVWGPVDLFFIDKDMRPPLEKSCRCRIPEKLVVTYEGRAWPNFMMGAPAQTTTVLESKLAVEGVDNKLLAVHLNAHLKINKSGETWLLEPRLDSTAAIQSFHGLRQFLDARGVMIPAPFSILDGTITMTARGAVDHDDKLIRSSVDFKVNLASNTQNVDLESTVRLDLARDFKSLDVVVQVLIKEMKIEMPPIDPVRGIPSVKTDSRLVFKPPAPAKPSAFKLRIFFDVKTANPGAVKLLSKLAEPYAPVTIDINTGNKGESSGSVRLEPFNISYLRRKVHVERLQVTLTEDENGDFPVGGRLRMDQTAYKIYVDLAGTLDAPIVNLNSEPFLPRADIISVLLFDRVNDQLVSADADTAGSFEAALADRAIGLFGLWAFATTPIRSFSYNAVTKVYTATVQLADGLTAGVGTNWERAAHLEVRKRVSRRWVLTASWSPSQEREQVGKLVLQWEKRF